MRSTLSRPIDELLVRAAVSWSLDPDSPPDEEADRLVELAAGNRTAVHRALGRLSHRQGPMTTPRGRAAHVLVLTLARGEWEW